MMTGIRPDTAMDLSNALGDLQRETDNLEVRLAGAATESGLDVVELSEIRTIGATSAVASRHLAWVVEELSAFSIDHYLDPVPRTAAVFGTPAIMTASSEDVQLAKLDAIWHDLNNRPPVARPTHEDFDGLSSAVVAATGTFADGARVIAMVDAGAPPSEAIRRVRAEGSATLGLIAAPTPREQVSEVLLHYIQRHGLRSRYSDPYFRVLRLDTDPAGVHTGFAVKWAAITGVSYEEAAVEVAEWISVPKWTPPHSNPGVPTFWADWEPNLARSKLEYAAIVAGLPEGATIDELDAAVTAHALSYLEQGRRENIAVMLLMMAAQPGGALPTLDRQAVREDATLDSHRDQINLAASVGLTGVDLTVDSPLGRAVGKALGNAVVAATFFDALDDGDMDSAFEIAVDFIGPQVAKLVFANVLPALAGPIGLLVSLVLTFTTFGGPKWDGPHREPAYGSFENGVAVANLHYSNAGGVLGSGIYR